MSYLLFNKKFIWFTSFFISIIVLNLYFYFKNSLIEVTINLITVLKNFSLIFLYFNWVLLSQIRTSK